MKLYSTLEHGFGKEPKLERGLGHRPDVIKVKLTWRALAGTWLQKQFGKYRGLRPQLTEHHSWNMAVESSRNVIHNNAD